MSATTWLIVLLVVLLVVLLLVGQQSSARYPDNFKGAVHGEGMKRRMQEMRVGAFVALDTLSDMVYPGPRERMLEYKKTKRSV